MTRLIRSQIASLHLVYSFNSKNIVSKEQYKKILISVLIGALVAFFSSLFDGLLDFLQNNGNNIAGGLVSAIFYVVKRG